MKDLKFKAWHNVANKMLDDSARNIFSWLQEGQDIVVLQSLGIKDKNGNEIFEGDDIKYSNYLGRESFHNVFRVDGGLVINAHSDEFNKTTPFYNACADMQTMQYIKQCEIIGNKYEGNLYK